MHVAREEASNDTATDSFGAVVRGRRWILRLFQVGTKRGSGSCRDGPAHRVGRISGWRVAVIAFVSREMFEPRYFARDEVEGMHGATI